MGKLMQSLGLAEVSSNVNSVPDGKYDAVVEKCEYFFDEAKDRVQRVISYRIQGTDPATKGKSAQEYDQIGKSPRDANGNFAKDEDSLAAFDSTMTEQNRQFYKKRFVDLLSLPGDKAGREAAEAHVDNPEFDLKDIVGIECVLTLKTNQQGYQNVTGAVKRDGNVTAPVATQAVTLGAPAPAATPSAQPSPSPAPQATSIAGGLA